ncbi:unnamed protein product, partial [marine sediment metagenome]
IANLCTAVGVERVYYMDTDSICVLSSDVHRLGDSISDQRLGALSVDKVCQKVIFHGPKHYQADEKRVCKGVPKAATQTGEHTFTYDQFLGSRSHQRLGETTGFIVQKVKKDVTPMYTKGQVAEDGRVTPWCLTVGT